MSSRKEAHNTDIKITLTWEEKKNTVKFLIEFRRFRIVDTDIVGRMQNSLSQTKYAYLIKRRAKKKKTS